jgi:hypothetical protein
VRNEEILATINAPNIKSITFKCCTSIPNKIGYILHQQSQDKLINHLATLVFIECSFNNTNTIREFQCYHMVYCACCCYLSSLKFKFMSCWLYVNNKFSQLKYIINRRFHDLKNTLNKKHLISMYKNVQIRHTSHI